MAVKRFDLAEVSYGYGDWWRRLWMSITLGTPLLLGLAAALPTARAPLPGEFFTPADLRAPWWGWLLTVGLVGMVVSAVAWLVQARSIGPRPKVRQGAVLEVHDDHFIIREGDAERRFEKRDIVHAFNARPGVVLRTRDGREIRLLGNGRLHAIHEALEPDPKTRAARVPVGSVARSVPLLGALTTMVFALSLVVTPVCTAILGEALRLGQGINTAELITLLVSWTLVTLSAIGLRRRSALVGTDGVRVDGTFGRRFVPYAEVARVEGNDEGDVVLVRHRGLNVKIPGVSVGLGLRERIEKARKAAREPARVPEELDRGTKSHDAWQSSLTAVGQESGYRRAALRIEELEAIVQNPANAPAARIGAAVALSHDDGRKAGIRIAAEASADRDLRAALEAAAEGEVSEESLRRAEKRFAEAASRRERVKG